MTPDRQWKRARLHLIITAIVAAVLTGTLFFPQNAFAAPAASPAAGAANAFCGKKSVPVRTAATTAVTMLSLIHI